jgi:hypothetical protein
MPIKAQTIAQAARKYVTHYRKHLQLDSANRFVDPRNCSFCIGFFDDLAFALEKEDGDENIIASLNSNDENILTAPFGKG